ncbi:uncharacterized protein LOC134542245 isoform X2 [Bacillus rossius redtenbacheri]
MVEGVVEEDSFNSTSYFDSLKLNASNKSWVELMEEEEMEDYSRGPWARPAGTEENMGMSEVTTAMDYKPPGPGPHCKSESPGPHCKSESPGPHCKSESPGPHCKSESPGPHCKSESPGPHCKSESPGPHCKSESPGPHCKSESPGRSGEPAGPSPVLIKQEVKSDGEEAEEVASVKCEAQVKREPCGAEVKTEETLQEQSRGCSRPPNRDDEDAKAWRREQELGQDDKRRCRGDLAAGSWRREPGPGQVDKKEKDEGHPAELLFNFETARKRRHPRRNPDGDEVHKQGPRYWEGQNAAKKQRRNLTHRDSSSSGSSHGSLDTKKQRKPVEYEKDPVILARRQKQIDYGKNTVGYDNYLQQVPKQSRTRQHPRTPPKYMKYSRRAWDGMVRIWRQQLHLWDSPSENTFQAYVAVDDNLLPCDEQTVEELCDGQKNQSEAEEEDEEEQETPRPTSANALDSLGIVQSYIEAVSNVRDHVWKSIFNLEQFLFSQSLKTAKQKKKGDF